MMIRLLRNKIRFLFPHSNNYSFRLINLPMHKLTTLTYYVVCVANNESCNLLTHSYETLYWNYWFAEWFAEKKLTFLTVFVLEAPEINSLVHGSLVNHGSLMTHGYLMNHGSLISDDFGQMTLYVCHFDYRLNKFQDLLYNRGYIIRILKPPNCAKTVFKSKMTSFILLILSNKTFLAFICWPLLYF